MVLNVVVILLIAIILYGLFYLIVRNASEEGALRALEKYDRLKNNQKLEDK